MIQGGTMTSYYEGRVCSGIEELCSDDQRHIQCECEVALNMVCDQ